MKASRLDCGVILPHRLKEKDIVFINAQNGPFRLHGVFFDETSGRYLRMKQGVASAFDDVFQNLNADTAGGRLRFKTDSPYIALFARQKNNIQLNMMSLCGQSGFDIYADNKYIGTYLPKTNVKNGFCDIVYTCGEMREYTLNFPLFDNVEELYIGLSGSSELLPADEHTNENKPIIFYGSSITQGAGASRPGNSYPAVVCRELRADYINFGFANRCLGQIEIAKYIRDLNKSAVIIGYDHNAKTVEELRENHYAFYKEVRADDKDLPIILTCAPDVAYKKGFEERRKVILETYNKAKSAGDNVFFADGRDHFGDCPFDCTVDNIHPNDLGYRKIAENILKTIKENKITG